MAERFPTTRWQDILERRRDPDDRRVLLGELFAAYRAPLVGHVRRRGLAPDAADDAVAELFVRLLERESLDQLTPERGRLRSFLLTVLDHQLANHHAAAVALKRGGGARIDGGDLQDVADLASPSADVAYDRAWAQTVMDRAFVALRAELVGGRRVGPVELLDAYVAGDGRPDCSELGRVHRMTESAVKSFLHRARRRYGELVRAEIGDTVRSELIDDELRHMVAALRS